MHRTYIKDELAVFWDSEKCFHSRRCVGSSAKIFDPLRRPWIDLSQAEAVMQLVGAESERAERCALRQLDGEVGAFGRGGSERLTDVMARIEASTDFPEEVEEEAAADRVAEGLRDAIGFFGIDDAGLQNPI